VELVRTNAKTPKLTHFGSILRESNMGDLEQPPSTPSGGYSSLVATPQLGLSDETMEGIRQRVPVETPVPIGTTQRCSEGNTQLCDKLAILASLEMGNLQHTQRFVLDKYLAHREGKVDMRGCDLTDFQAGGAAYKRVGPLQSADDIEDACDQSRTLIIYPHMRKCQKNNFSPQPLHLARVLDPFVEALGCIVNPRSDLRAAKYLALRSGTWLREDMLIAFALCLHHASRKHRLDGDGDGDEESPGKPAGLLPVTPYMTNAVVVNFEKLQKENADYQELTFYFSMGVDKSKKVQLSELVADYRFLCFPVSLENHYIFFLYWHANSKLIRFDSMGGKANQCAMAKKLAGALEFFLRKRKGSIATSDGVCPVQTDNHMCGVCVARSMEILMAEDCKWPDGGSFDKVEYKPETNEKYRLQMLYWILMNMEW
jgi:hypothetical protein